MDAWTSNTYRVCLVVGKYIFLERFTQGKVTNSQNSSKQFHWASIHFFQWLPSKVHALESIFRKLYKGLHYGSLDCSNRPKTGSFQGTFEPGKYLLQCPNDMGPWQCCQVVIGHKVLDKQHLLSILKDQTPHGATPLASKRTINIALDLVIVAFLR